MGATAATTLIAGGTHAAAATAVKSPPIIQVGMSAKKFAVSGSLTQGTGPISFEVNTYDGEHTLSIFSKKSTYSFDQMRKDVLGLQKVGVVGGKANAEAAKRLEANVTTLGGVDSNLHLPVKATVVLAPGTYYLSDNGGKDVLGRLKKLTVTTTPNGARMPKAAATLKMTGKKTFTGDTTLPRRGTIKLVNGMTSGSRWYVAALYPVKEGTTAEQVRAFLAGETQDNSMFLGYVVGGDTLSPGRSQFLNYSALPGTYALVCQFPDLDKPGTTYAGNGMVRMVRLTY
ncbi:MAG TPA: hypothetical protein VNC22_07335 [Sporichthya sp.]|nr:hypothetical protein [Sporichthya sp.]